MSLILKELADARKYRVECPVAMPNPYKEQTKSALHSKLEAARRERASKVKSDVSGDGAGVAKNAGKKVLKKPVPNFGGGVLGTK